MDAKQSRGSFQKVEGRNSLDSALDASQQLSDQYFCTRCNQTMHSGEKDQHNDWHFAKDLQAQETMGSSLDSIAGPQASDQSSQFSPPPYPPPKGGTSRAAAVRRHTNQIIKVAEIRARDEVHFPSILA